MAGQNPNAPYARPLSTGAFGQDATTYKGNLDSDIACLARIAAAFAPQALPTPIMKVTVGPGALFLGSGQVVENGAFVPATLNSTTSVTVAEAAGISGTMLVTGPGIPANTTGTISGTTVTLSSAATLTASSVPLVFSQLTSTITAPVSNSRIDRVVINNATGALSIIAGTPGASPTAPAITAGNSPVCRVLIASTSTSITNSMITDERNFAFGGLGTAAKENLGTVIVDDGAGNLTIGTNQVTNAMAAQMPSHTFQGNNTGSTGNVLNLTATQLTAELNAFVGDSGSGGTKGLVPAPAAGDGAAKKTLLADGTWGTSLQIYKSAPQTISSAGSLTLAHGLPGVPKFLEAELVCQSNEANYTSGQVVQAYITSSAVGSSSQGAGIVKDATNLTLRFSSNGSVYSIEDASSGNNANLTNGNWKVIFYAFY